LSDWNERLIPRLHLHRGSRAQRDDSADVCAHDGSIVGQSIALCRVPATRRKWHVHRYSAPPVQVHRATAEKEKAGKAGLS
jgi:hypothetical protein